MSVEDLENLLAKINVERIYDPAEPSAVGEVMPAFPWKHAAFVLGYPSRLIRSVLAITGITAAAERFGDVRKRDGFWTAYMELGRYISFQQLNDEETREVIRKRTIELTKQIPALLTQPETPENTIPSTGRLVTGLIPEVKRAEWVFDFLGELLIEANVIHSTKNLAAKGMSKLTRGAYGMGEDIVKKKGVSRLLGNLDDDEIRAIDEAVQFRRYGKLGTKPPQNQIDNAIRRTLDYIEESKPSRLTKKEIISAKRKQAAAKMYKVQGGGYGEGYSVRLRKAGTTTSTEKSFTPLLKVSDEAADDLITLQKVIDNHDFGGSKIYTVANTQEALEKLYTNGTLLTAGEVEGLRDVFGKNFADSLYKFTSKPTGLAGKIFEAGHKGLRALNSASRTLMTTGELSYLLRQGNYRAWARPREAIRSFAVANRSLISKKYADHIDDAIRFSR